MIEERNSVEIGPCGPDIQSLINQLDKEFKEDLDFNYHFVQSFVDFKIAIVYQKLNTLQHELTFQNVDSVKNKLEGLGADLNEYVKDLYGNLKNGNFGNVKDHLEYIREIERQDTEKINSALERTHDKISFIAEQNNINTCASPPKFFRETKK